MTLKQTLYTVATLATGISGYFFISNQQNPQLLPQPAYADAVHEPNSRNVFYQADAYKYAHNYKAAKLEFDKIRPQLTDHNDQLYAHNQLTFIALEMNNDSLAGEYLRQIEPQILPQTPPSVKTDFFYNKGVWAYRSFHPKEAEYCLRQSLIHAQKASYPPDHLKFARAYTMLGALQYDFAHSPDSAFKYLPKAMDIFKNDTTLDPWSAECRFAMALVKGSHRQYSETEAYCDKTISILETKPHLDSVLLTRAWLLKARLSSLKLEQNDKHEKDKNAENQETQKRKIDDYFQKAFQYCPLSNSRLQECYREEMRYCIKLMGMKEAGSEMRFVDRLQALERVIERQKTDQYGWMDYMRGVYFSSKTSKNLDSSLFYHKRFTQNYMRDTTHQRAGLANAYAALGIVYAGFARKTGQIHYLDSALECYKTNLLHYANVKNQQLAWSDILKPTFYQKSSFQFVSFGQAANLFYQKFQMKGNPRHLDTALLIARLTDQLLFANVNSQDEEAHTYIAYDNAEMVYQVGINAAHLLYKKTNNPRYLNLVFMFGERVRSFLLYRDAVFKDANALLNVQAPPSSFLEKINHQAAKVYELTVNNDKSSGLDARLTQNLGEEQGVLNELYTEMQRLYPNYYRYKIEQPIPSVRAVQKQLKPDQWFVQYTFLDTSLMAFFISRDTVSLHKMAWNANWDSTVLSFYNNVSGHTSNLVAAHFADTSTALFSQLFPKNLPPQYQRCHELIVCPDRELNLIPFEALTRYKPRTDLTFDKLPYLIHSFPITYAPSWKIYETFKDAQLPVRPTLHGYTYSLDSIRFKTAHEEFKILKSLFDTRAHFSTDKNCTAEKFMADSTNHSDILHLSLHAESNPLSKDDNKIYFGDAFSDILQGTELLKRRFNAHLVMLSTCESGFGKIKKGEGAYALSRIFQRLGVPRVVASLWSIPQNSTAHISSAFYTHLLHRETPALALQKAKIHYLKSNERFFCHPQYWAGLVCLD
jgi:CHAT domain-containing protein